MIACLATARVSEAAIRMGRARRRLLAAGAPDWPTRHDPRHTPCSANLSRAERDAGCVGVAFIVTPQVLEESVEQGVVIHPLYEVRR